MPYRLYTHQNYEMCFKTKAVIPSYMFFFFLSGAGFAHLTLKKN